MIQPLWVFYSISLVSPYFFFKSIFPFFLFQSCFVVVGKYLTHLYCTCVLLTESESDNFPILNYGTNTHLNLTTNEAYVQIMLIKYNDGNLNDLLESGINSGCQVI